jgi:hypothetical protein
MAEWLYVSGRAWKRAQTHLYSNSNEGLRLQPPIPSGSQRSLGRGKGSRLLGKL